MINLYFEENGVKSYIGSYKTRPESVRAANVWLETHGYTREPYSRSWITTDDEEYEDFGSWSAFFVRIGREEKPNI